MAWSDRTTASAPFGGRQNGVSPLGPAGDWLRQVLRTVISRAGHLFTLVVVVLLPFGMMNGMVSWYAFRNAVVGLGEVPSFRNEGVGVPVYLAVGGSYLLLLVAALLLVVAASRQVLAADAGRPELWSFSLSDGVRRLPPALGVATVVGALVVAVLFVVSLLGGIVPPLLPITFLLWLVASVVIAVRLGFGPIVAALGPAGTRSLRTAWDLTRAHFWPVFGRVLLLAVTGLVITLLAMNVAGLFTALAGGAEMAPVDPADDELRFEVLLDPNPLIHAIGVLVGSLGQGAALVVWAGGLGLLYRDLGGPVEDRLTGDDAGGAEGSGT